MPVNQVEILVQHGRTVSSSVHTEGYVLKSVIDFLVNNTQLPNITFPLPRNFAGSIPVNRQEHANNTLFFWGFEKSEGSLTAESSGEPWLLWLQGGYVDRWVVVPEHPLICFCKGLGRLACSG